MLKNSQNTGKVSVKVLLWPTPKSFRVAATLMRRPPRRPGPPLSLYCRSAEKAWLQQTTILRLSQSNRIRKPRRYRGNRTQSGLTGALTCRTIGRCVDWVSQDSPSPSHLIQIKPMPLVSKFSSTAKKNTNILFTSSWSWAYSVEVNFALLQSFRRLDKAYTSTNTQPRTKGLYSVDIGGRQPIPNIHGLFKTQNWNQKLVEGFETVWIFFLRSRITYTQGWQLLFSRLNLSNQSNAARD